jgi:hypothetical protein
MKTVYYFGAGASANAIPTIDGLKIGLLEFNEILKQYLTKNLDELDPRIFEYKDDLSLLVKINQKIIFDSNWHQTFDTLARKYYLQNKYGDYDNLKIALSVYFLYVQFFLPNNFIDAESSHTTNVDKRYDSLFATILKKDEGNNIRINNNISIITWNYDLQIELALYNYDPQLVNKIKIKYNIHPNRGSFDNFDELESSCFSVVKLNGNAFLDLGHLSSKTNTIYDVLLAKVKDEEFLDFSYFLGECLTHLSFVKGFSKNDDKTFLRYFNFSWEKPQDDVNCYLTKNKITEQAQKIMENTENLIIVGYSFPDFNFDMDKEVFSKSKIKKIVIQDNNPDEIEKRLIELLPQKRSKQTKDNIFPVIEKIQPGNYFPSFW